jgi:zinc ribbon protein
MMDPGGEAVAGSRRFCTQCGHELRPGAQFCTFCGHAAAQATQPVALPEEGPPDAASAEVTARQPTVTGPEVPGPQPLAAPLTEQPEAEASFGTGYFAPPQHGYPPAVDYEGPGTRGRHRSRWPVVLGIVALLAAGGAGAALYLTHSAHHSAATSQGNPGVARTPRAPGSTPAVTPSPPASPAAAAPAQVSVDGLTVGISAVSTDPNAAAVARTMGTYFGGIDAKDYLQAWNTFAPALQAAIPYQPWSGSLRTTRDSHVDLQSVRHDPNGDVDVTVSFRSHQAPQDGPDPGETCTNWSLEYRLTPASTSSLPYLIKKVKKVGPGHVACGSA